MKLRLLLGMAGLIAGLLCAQPPGPGGFGPQGRFGGRGPMANLGLTAEQQNKIYTAVSEVRVQTKVMRDQSRDLRTQLDAAIKAGDEAKIDSLSADLSRLEGQIMAIQSKAQSRIYGSLTPDQKAKVDQRPGGLGFLMRSRPPGPPQSDR